MIPVIVHLVGEDAIRGQLDAPPDPTHNFLFLRNVVKKDGKALAYIDDDAQVVLYAWSRITFVEVMQDISLPSSGAAPMAGVGQGNGAVKPAGTTVLGFFRDDES